MQQPLRITFHGIGPTDAIDRRIRTQFAELERLHDDITGCHVTVDASHRLHRMGKLYSVRLDIHLPGHVIVVGANHLRQEHEDVYAAIREAFDAAVRQIDDHARARRQEVEHRDAPDHESVS